MGFYICPTKPSLQKHIFFPLKLLEAGNFDLLGGPLLARDFFSVYNKNQ
jgi:hypothetical protein